MSKEIVIEPATRLEGHAKIVIKLDKNNKVEDAHFGVTVTRFFEKFVEGRLMERVIRIVPRICGICPEAHHLASVSAVEAAWGITPPKAALKLRDLLLQAKTISSHALHFYALAAPDFLVGPLAEPQYRNVVTVIKHLPDAGKKAIELMKIGQELCFLIGGRAVHPVTSVPGGQSKPMTEEERDEQLKRIDRAMELTKFTVDLAKKVVGDYLDVITKLGVFDSYYIGLAKGGAHTIFGDATVRVMSPDGKIAADFAKKDYLNYVAEHVAPHSYATHIFFKPVGYPEGIWRAGPLGRINVVDKMETPLAQEALKEFRDAVGRPCNATLAYNWARIVELVEAVEKAKMLLEDPDIVSTDVKLADVEPKEGNGVGIVEAPRGTLIHHYWSDEKGICTKANLIVATNHNIAAVEKSFLVTAKQIFEDKIHEKLKLPEPMIKT
ncbi:MAG: Ni/Fe hydrogenase subunit alpha [Candidatus Jordarchaeaceae archaeon]